MSDPTFVKYAEFYDLCNKNKPYKKEVNFVYQWADRPKSLLDLGCGTASYWKYFPKSIELYGIDKSPSMIDQSKYKGRIWCGDITKIKCIHKFDCVTALFDVINYLPRLSWFKRIPLHQGGYFIFDIWNKEKANKEGFIPTLRGDRTIKPLKVGKDKVDLNISSDTYSEIHTMYLHSDKDIQKACGKYFKIIDTIDTKTWQTWYKLEKI